MHAGELKEGSEPVGERGRGAGVAVVVAVATASVVLPGMLREWRAQAAGVTPVIARHRMAEISLHETDGGTWRLGEYRGKVVAINLWATWCEPCREETPGMVRVVRELGPKGFAVVGVSLDQGDREAKVRAFAERYGVTYPIAFPDAMSQMSASLGGLPTTLLIDREGRVAKTYVGAVREGVLRRDVGELLGEGAG